MAPPPPSAHRPSHAPPSPYGIPGIPLYITQRGVNRCAIFLDDDDRRHCLDLLIEGAKQHDLRIHGYVLMGNHVHLSLTPAASGQIARVMQALGRRYVRYINDRYRRTGTLWEGRYKSSLVDRETYLLHCYRYIELNPVCARMTADPID